MFTANIRLTYRRCVVNPKAHLVVFHVKYDMALSLLFLSLGGAISYLSYLCCDPLSFSLLLHLVSLVFVYTVDGTFFFLMLHFTSVRCFKMSCKVWFNFLSKLPCWCTLSCRPKISSIAKFRLPQYSPVLITT